MKLISLEPFAPQREQTDGDPHRVETCGGVRAERERVDHEECARHDVHALIEERIAVRLFERDQRVGKEEEDRTSPAEDVDEELRVCHLDPMRSFDLRMNYDMLARQLDETIIR